MRDYDLSQETLDIQEIEQLLTPWVVEHKRKSNQAPIVRIEADYFDLIDIIKQAYSEDRSLYRQYMIDELETLKFSKVNNANADTWNRAIEAAQRRIHYLGRKRKGK